MASDREWYQLPIPAAMARLIEIRNELRQKNLHDTEEPPFEHPQDPIPPDVLTARTNDGTFNDLGCPFMGRTNAR
jgi:hypothetical protein